MKEETKSYLGISYLYTIIKVIFSVVYYLMAYIVTGSENIDKRYIINNSVLFLIFASIWFVLYKLNKKQNQGLGDVFKDNTVRKSAGALILISCLISMWLYIPALINTVSQIISKSDDGTVVLSIISFMIFLFQIFIAIYFLKYKGKTDGSFSGKVVMGIAFLFTAITASFSLVSKLSDNIISHSSIKLNFFIWFAATAIVLIILYILIRKQNQSLISIIDDIIIRKSVGILILIAGIISISSVLHSLLSTVWMIQVIGGIDRRTELDFIVYIARLIIFVFQILLGKYMLKYFKNESTDLSIEQ